MEAIALRPEDTTDAGAIRILVGRAFADEDTAAFVQAVRDLAEVCLAEVAMQGGEIVGHAQWCAAPILVDGRRVPAAYLACLAVAPDQQRRGVGSHLVASGLRQLAAKRYAAASLLGDPAYYGRFGFSAALAARIEAPHRSQGAGFQAVELIAGALDGTCLIGDFPAVIAP